MVSQSKASTVCYPGPQDRGHLPQRGEEAVSPRVLQNTWKRHEDTVTRIQPLSKVVDYYKWIKYREEAITFCNGLHCVPTLNSYVETLNSHVIVSRNSIFEDKG